MLRAFRAVSRLHATPIVPILVPFRTAGDKIDTKKLILKLRQESQLPLGSCRAALIATDWDLETAQVFILEEAKRMGIKKMESLASRKTPEGLVGVAQSADRAAMIVVNCESEPVSKTPEFNRLVTAIATALANEAAAEYSEEEIKVLPGVTDILAEGIGLLRENIKIQKGIVIQAANVGVYVRNQNKDYPMNGTYAAVVGLTAGDSELSGDLATHCVLELPAETGSLPSSALDIESVGEDEARLLYQALNGGNEVVFNVLHRHRAQLESWHRFQINA